VSFFVDTAVIMYAAGSEHRLRAPCQQLLRWVVEGGVDGVTSAEVIQEILHRFTARGDATLGAAMARHALEVFAPVLPITHEVMRRMPDLIVEHPHLAARDVVHVATCQETEIGTIVSPDRGFDTVTGLVRVDPADEQALTRLRG
jgi:uncharacterized protein